MAPTPRGLGIIPANPQMRNARQIDTEARVIAQCYIVAQRLNAKESYLAEQRNKLIALTWALNPIWNWNDSAQAADDLIEELKEDTPE